MNHVIYEEKEFGNFAYKTISTKGHKQLGTRPETVKAIQIELQKQREIKRQKMI